jgi:hypothetical protein
LEFDRRSIVAETSIMNERLGVVDNLVDSICEYAEIKLSTIENLKDTEEIKTAFQLIMDLCGAAKIIITEVQKELPATDGSKAIEATRKT